MRGLAVAFLLLSACPPKGDVPVTLTNPPQCTVGKGGMMEGLKNNVAIRVEVGGVARDSTLPGLTILAQEWAGREATVSIGTCRAAEDPNPGGKGLCDGISFQASHKTTIRGDEKGLFLDLPTAPILCFDGSQATFKKEE